MELPKMHHLCQSFMPAHTKLLIVNMYCLCSSCTICQRTPCKQFFIKMKCCLCVVCSDRHWLPPPVCFTGDVSLSAVLSVCWRLRNDVVLHWLSLPAVHKLSTCGRYRSMQLVTVPLDITRCRLTVWAVMSSVDAAGDCSSQRDSLLTTCEQVIGARMHPSFLDLAAEYWPNDCLRSDITKVVYHRFLMVHKL